MGILIAQISCIVILIGLVIFCALTAIKNGRLALSYESKLLDYTLVFTDDEMKARWAKRKAEKKAFWNDLNGLLEQMENEI